MNIFQLENPEDIFTFLKNYRKSTHYKFRGQSDGRWPLIPKAGRLPFNKINDKDVFKQWKRRAVAYVTDKNLNACELLSIAQHTGLPTRLLDWTHNPLVALFFACYENENVEGAIFAYKSKEIKSISDIDDPYGFVNESVKMIQPNSSHSRLINQFSYFTIHTDPTFELEQDVTEPNIDKLIIARIFKKEIIFILNQLGVNNMTIFPDLDGLSKHLSWFYENLEYWNEKLDFPILPEF